MEEISQTDISSHQSKYAEIVAWLRELYGGELLPPFEKNNDTIDLLFDLMNEIKQRSKDSSLLCEDTRAMAEDYALESRRQHQILRNLGITDIDFTARGQQEIKSLSDIVSILNSKDTSLTSLYVTLIDAVTKNLDVQEKNENLQNQKTDILDKTRNALSRLNELQRILLQLRDSETDQTNWIDEKRREMSYLATKTEEYKATRANLRDTLNATGVTPREYHSTLKELYDRICVMKKEMKEPMQKLKSYADLPPDIQLARLKVEETRRELEGLEERLQAHVSSMTFE